MHKVLACLQVARKYVKCLIFYLVYSTRSCFFSLQVIFQPSSRLLCHLRSPMLILLQLHHQYSICCTTSLFNYLFFLRVSITLLVFIFQPFQESPFFILLSLLLNLPCLVLVPKSDVVFFSSSKQLTLCE